MIKEIPLHSVKIQDKFWSNYQKLVTEKVIPYQYEVLNDSIDVDVQAERLDDSLPTGKSHALENFRITAGESKGEHFGWIFQDSDVYKWLESVGYSLINHPDTSLEALADEVIELISKAQAEDGYLDTYFQLKSPELKYRMLHFSHELYCAGHLIEAAIAYDQGTGKTSLLEVAKKVVANIEVNFGYEEGKINGADGHQEIELALVRLAEHTGDISYLELADFFIDVRGLDTEFYQKQVDENIEANLDSHQYKINTSYLQANAQPKNQRIAQGHAVRMLYMTTGMAKIAQHTGNKELIEACESIWEDITKRKMYVTAGVGSTVHGEAFVGAYDLPNDTMYCETCASIALVYFAHEMFKINLKKEYIDVLERALYNGVLSGASIDGTHFFYVNPLEVHPDSCQRNPCKGHVKTTRPDWFGCACCPPNFARLVGSLQKYVYLEQENNIFVNLFMISELILEGLEIKQETNFPYSNEVTIEAKGNQKKLYIRKPEWMTEASIETESLVTETSEYFIVDVNGEVMIKLSFEQPILTIRSNPKVWSNSNLIAIQKGPFVYCGEGIDNENDLFSYRLSFEEVKQAKSSVTNALLEETLTLKVPARKIVNWQEEALYQFVEAKEISEDSILTLIPYHLWGNRGINEMRVWFPN